MDCLSYFIENNDESTSDDSMLFDLKLTKLHGLDSLVEKVERPFAKKALGFYMIEYVLEFVYNQQLFTIKFNTEEKNYEFKKNTFAA